MSRASVFVACALAAAATAGVISGTASEAAPGDPPVLPDLVSDPPSDIGLEQYSDVDGTRLLLRFDGFIHNAGQGAAEMRGSNPTGGEMQTVVQRLYQADGTAVDSARPTAHMRYETSDGHNHWHLGEAARYSLWNSARSAEVAPAMKVGFCLEDSEWRDPHAPANPAYSDSQVSSCFRFVWEPQLVRMGVSAGWRDVYDRSLALQWVDVSNVSPGSYWLRADVDPNGIVQESTEQNAPGYASAASVVPGYVAQPLVRQGLDAGVAAKLALGAAQFGSPGARQFRIESAPSHGQLDVPTGTWFTGPDVTYLPDPDYSGADSFTFSARDSSSGFPRNPVMATAALGVDPSPGQVVAISGAPSQLYTGASAQLHATVANGGGVTWSVDGIPGGNSSVGTITPQGLYTAPAAPPPGGRVAIRATASSGAFAKVEVAIAYPPPPTPSPTPQSGGTKPPKLLSNPRVTRNGRFLFVRTVPGRTGTVETKALVGSRRVGMCRTRAPKRRPVTCKLYVPRRYKMKKVLLVVKLRVGHRAVATRRARAT